MNVNATTDDLWKLWVKTLIVLILVIGFMVYKDVRHDAALRIAGFQNVVNIHDQNFGAIKNWQESVEARFQRLELAAQITGNIVETGELDAQGNPVKK